MSTGTSSDDSRSSLPMFQSVRSDDDGDDREDNNNNNNNNNHNNYTRTETQSVNTSRVRTRARAQINNFSRNSSMLVERITDCHDPPVRRAWGIGTVIALIVSIVLIAVSLKKVTSVEYGVQYDRWAKQLEDSARQGGLYFGPVGYRFVKFPSTQITAQVSDVCLSRDGLRVAIDATFQYQLSVDDILEVILKYRNFKGWSLVVEAAGVSAVQHTCSEFNVTDFQTLRTIIQDNMLSNLKLKLEGSLEDDTTDSGIYALANSLQLKNIELPAKYKEAVASKQRAEEDIALAKNQRTQETTKAQTELLAAEEEARKIMNTAYNTGNVTVIEAKLKAEETLYAFSQQQFVLEQAKLNFGLNADGILAYMTNQLYGATESLKVVAGEPARISRKDEL